MDLLYNEASYGSRGGFQLFLHHLKNPPPPSITSSALEASNVVAVTNNEINKLNRSNMYIVYSLSLSKEYRLNNIHILLGKNAEYFGCKKKARMSFMLHT